MNIIKIQWFISIGLSSQWNFKLGKHIHSWPDSWITFSSMEICFVKSSWVTARFFPAIGDSAVWKLEIKDFFEREPTDNFFWNAAKTFPRMKGTDSALFRDFYDFFDVVARISEWLSLYRHFLNLKNGSWDWDENWPRAYLNLSACFLSIFFCHQIIPIFIRGLCLSAFNFCCIFSFF